MGLANLLMALCEMGPHNKFQSRMFGIEPVTTGGYSGVWKLRRTYSFNLIIVQQASTLFFYKNIETEASYN